MRLGETDLINEGNIGIMRAAKKSDPEGVTFISALWRGLVVKMRPVRYRNSSSLLSSCTKSKPLVSFGRRR